MNLGPREEAKRPQKSDVYYDPRDKSENVPIAGIKKHHYEPGRVPRHPDLPAKPKPAQTQPSNGPKMMTLSQMREDEH